MYDCFSLFYSSCLSIYLKVNLVFWLCVKYCWGSLVAQMVQTLLAMQETWIGSLGQEDLLEKETATHSSILAWRIPWTKEPGHKLMSTESMVPSNHLILCHSLFLLPPIFPSIRVFSSEYPLRL